MKKLLILGILVVCIGVSVFVWKAKTSSSIKADFTISEDQLKNKNFLKNKQAVLFYSSTADQDFDNKGISYAVFIDDAGEAAAYQMKGLELGSIAKGENNVLLADKNNIRLIGDNYKEFTQEKPQYTGERTGILKQGQVYFSIYNTGVNSENGTYDSNVLFGDETGFNQGNIPYYILTSGVTDATVPILTYDIEKNEYDLREVSFEGNEIAIRDIVRLQNKENLEYANLSPIVSDDEFYYFVLSEFVGENSGNVVVYKINKETNAEEKLLLAEYRNSEETFTSIPFNVKNSTHIHKNIFYYIDGLGNVYGLNKGSNKIELKFTIENPPKDGVRHGEGTHFQDDKLYVLRNSTNKTEEYYIETYSLSSGKKETDIPIKNLKEILASVKGKSVHSYDFKMLD
jgi:hypothetical protein